MAESAKVLNNCSSILVNSEVNNEINTCSRCKDYEKLLKETLDEIKSVQTINRLLQKELLERTAHTNTWETDFRVADKDINPNASSEWTLVNTTNHMTKSTTCNKSASMTTGQSVKTSNRYTPLLNGISTGNPRKQVSAYSKLQHNLHQQERKPTKPHDKENIPTTIKGQISVSNCGKVNTKETAQTINCNSTTQRNKAHKILIIGDSHVRSCASNVKTNIKGNFKVQGIVKPGAEAIILTNSVKNEIKSIPKSDVVVLCGGANDVGLITPQKPFNRYQPL